MPFNFSGLSLKVKDNPFGFEDANIIRNDDLYLKQQSEVLVDQDATTIKPDVITESALAISNAAFDGGVLGYQASNLTWQSSSLDDVMYWLNIRI